MLRTTVLRRSIPRTTPVAIVNAQLAGASNPIPQSFNRYHVRAGQTNTTPRLRGASLLRVDNPRSHLRQHPVSISRDSLRFFRATPSRQGWPLVAVLAGFLKTSVALEYVRMAARIALTFVPVVLLKNHATRRYIRHVIGGKPEFEEKKTILENKIRQRSIFNKTLIFFPLFVFGLTLLASLERTPLSGRWRLILLSPEEEDEIAQQLAGAGWYHAIGEILSEEGPTRILPPSDWRYQWVLETLRGLETVVPLMCKEKYDDAHWFRRGPDEPPMPPPPAYPLVARPTAREMLHMFCRMVCDQPANPAPHIVQGPPFSLVVVDKPECANAFSFGFGPNGGGGVVVYSGFLDQVISNTPRSQEAAIAQKSSFLSSLLGSLFSITPARSQAPPPDHPTPEQTAQLAILLAHELSHLILSHHLETLSSGTVIIPGTVSMIADLLRALLFPVTMLFGPFVNDAVANIGKVGTGEFGKLSEYCTTVMQEFEADTVSARILAHAGFDARDAVSFWERRGDLAASECSTKRAEERSNAKSFFPQLSIGLWSTHPVRERRITNLKKELSRWEEQRQRALEESLKAKAGAEGL